MAADDLDKLLAIALFHSRSSCHAATSKAGSEYRNNIVGYLGGLCKNSRAMKARSPNWAKLQCIPEEIKVEGVANVACL